MSRTNMTVAWRYFRKTYKGVFPYLRTEGVHSSQVEDWLKLHLASENGLCYSQLDEFVKVTESPNVNFSAVEVAYIGNLEDLRRTRECLECVYIADVKFDGTTSYTKSVLQNHLDYFVGTYSQNIVRKNPHKLIINEETGQRYVSIAPSRVPSYARKQPVTCYNAEITKFCFPYAELRIHTCSYFNVISLIKDVSLRMRTDFQLLREKRIKYGPFTVVDCLQKHDLYSDNVMLAVAKYTPIYVDYVKPYVKKYLEQMMETKEQLGVE